MSNYKEKDNFEKWSSQWEKALNSDEFKTVEKPAQEAPENFFGMKMAQPGEELNGDDVGYWNDLYEMIKYHGYRGPVFDEYMAKGKKAVKKSEKVLTEAATLSPAPPISASSVGKDQDVTNIDMKSDVGHLERLEALKVKLHNLIDKLNGFEANGQSGNKLESQIETIQKQIDELSNNISGISDLT